MLDFIQGLFKAAREYFERQDDALWREFLEDVEAAYERDQNHTFLIQVFEASLTDESVRRRIVEKIFQARPLITPAWDVFREIVHARTPVTTLRFMDRTLSGLPSPALDFMDPYRVELLGDLLYHLQPKYAH